MSAVAAVKDLVVPQHSGLFEALMAAQQEFEPALKSAENTFHKSRYVDLAGVYDACKAALWRHGLNILHRLIYRDGVTVLVTELRHASGETEASEYPLLPAKANDPQALGAALTYARRYCIMAMLAIAPEDDDGNLASGRNDNGAPKAQPARMPAKPAPSGAAAPAVSTPAATDPVRVTIKQVQQLQIAIKELSLGGTTADEKRTNRIGWVKWASGQAELESTSDLLATNFDKVLAKARNGEVPVFESQLGDGK